MQVIHDNGGEFTGFTFQQLLCLLNINPLPTTNKPVSIVAGGGCPNGCNCNCQNSQLLEKWLPTWMTGSVVIAVLVLAAFVLVATITLHETVVVEVMVVFFLCWN